MIRLIPSVTFMYRLIFSINMDYIAKKDQRYPLEKMTPEELDHLKWLFREYESCSSWMVFQQRTGHGIVQAAQRKRGKEWSKDTLYLIQLDLLGNKMITTRFSNGPASPMIEGWAPGGAKTLVEILEEWKQSRIK